MIAILASIGVLLLGAPLALLAPGGAPLIGAAVVTAGSLLGLWAAIASLATGAPAELALPLCGATVGIDALSALFLIPLFVVGPLAVTHGVASQRHGAEAMGSAAMHFALLPLLLGSMALVFVARDGALLLLAFMATSVIRFYLVTRRTGGAAARQHGWTLAASGTSAAALLSLVLLLGDGATAFTAYAGARPTPDSALFVLALVAFGLEMGLVPTSSAPLAPSHVAAIGSGLVVKLGVYGLLRTVTFLGPPPAWWGGLLVLLGLGSALLAMATALTQRDLRRLLDCSAAANQGLLLVGIGLSLLGAYVGSPALAVLGMAGALLHVFSHAVVSGALFLGAGAMIHAAGASSIDRMGGLLRRMPLTGRLFGVGAAAATGLPPQIGFASVLLLYLAALAAVASSRREIAIVGIGTMAGLALVTGLTAFTFARALRAALFGRPRSPEASGAREPDRERTLPLLAFATLAVLAGLLAPLLLAAIAPAVSEATGYDLLTAINRTRAASSGLWTASRVSAAVIVISLALRGLLRRMKRGDDRVT